VYLQKNIVLIMASKKIDKVSQTENNNLSEPNIMPEIFFGLIGPVGTDLDITISSLTSELKELGYRVEKIKLSSILPLIKNLDVPLNDKFFDEKINSYMTAGTTYKKKMGRGDALALAAVIKLREIRHSITGDSMQAALKVAYIFDSLKNVEEVNLLRKIYGDLFFLISVYSPREKRKDTLAKKISKSYGKATYTKYYSNAEELIERDYNEEAGSSGQNVGAAFHLADLFIDEGDKESLKANIKRFVEILFGFPFHTPSKEEYGQFLASIAALRSADLSRQVGAVILNDDGGVTALGCNEVPKVDGGLYWPGINDFRDHKIGFDSSAKAKNEMLNEIITNLFDEGFFDKTKVPNSETFIQEITEGKHKDILKDSTVSNILEFGRIVHAEMAAITDAAKRGMALEGKTLFCTTFPCHICARHIIASGIKKVYYIEPYPKSKTKDLYGDSVCIDSPIDIDNKINFKSFIGISPNKAAQLFKMTGKRKTPSGDAIEWSAQTAKFRFTVYLPLYLKMEEGLILEWKDLMDKIGLI
jgi:deoxycytidylate deaminase